jgi:hypothetical protein
VHRIGVTLAVCVVVPSHAAAEKEPFFLTGVTLGAALHDASDNGFLLGAEVSGGLVFEKWTDESGKGTPIWFGGYLDALYDFGSDATRFSIGPEVGAWYLGLDGGLVRELEEPGRYGFAIRPALTVGFASLFVRYTHFFESTPEDTHVEVGVLLKYPFAPDLRVY